jgi:hypothetical protein
MGNVSDVLLKFYHFKNQHNTKELPHYFALLTIKKEFFKPIMALDSVKGIMNYEF